VLARFVAALESADFDAMRALLAADVVAYSDGGGRVRAARHPLVGIDRVMRFYAGIRRRVVPHDMETVEVNGQTALLGWFGGVRLLLAVHVVDGRIREVHSILNPDKLRYLERQRAAASGSAGDL
jgi:RNA polymerase sigma-70 factor (ECF subfamily)